LCSQPSVASHNKSPLRVCYMFAMTRIQAAPVKAMAWFLALVSDQFALFAAQPTCAGGDACVPRSIASATGSNMLQRGDHVSKQLVSEENLLDVEESEAAATDVRQKEEEFRSESERSLMQAQRAHSGNTISKAPETGKLFVLALGGEMYRANSDGSEVQPYITSNTPCSAKGIATSETQQMVNYFSSRPTSVAIDEDANRIFWTDWQGGSRVQEVDPSTDPLNRSVVRWSFNASILSAPLNGSAVIPVLTSGEVIQDRALPPIYWEPATQLSWPYFIALDRSAQKIYWTDRIESKIQRCNYDGSDLDMDFHSTEWQPAGIAVDSESGRLYYAAQHQIYYVPLVGGASTLLARSVGIVEGIDYDPVQNYVYFVSAGTTRNPGGILRVHGYRPTVTRAEWCGIGSNGRPYNTKPWASCEHVVYLPAGSNDVSIPFDVKGDFNHATLFWSGYDQGMGGRVYRTNLCTGMPTQGFERSNDDGVPRGDFAELFRISGTWMAPKTLQGLAVLPGAVDSHSPCEVENESTVEEPEGPEPPECYDDEEWLSSTGYSCLDYEWAKWCEGGTVGPAWDAAWGTFNDFASAEGKSADEACCACGSASQG